jgi:hypothetical protein
MEKIDSDLGVPLTKIGESGTRVIFTKTATYSPNGAKKWRKKIILANPIELGKPIIKEDFKKKGKLRTPCKFFATLTKVVGIQPTTNIKEFNIFTDKSDYKVRIL